jgi:hypothetical protein
LKKNGADLLYLFNGYVLVGDPVTIIKQEKHNSILLQNAYIAYSLNSKKLHNLEVYLSTRNAADSNIIPLASDNRRFYGAGVKFDF